MPGALLDYRRYGDGSCFHEVFSLLEETGKKTSKQTSRLTISVYMICMMREKIRLGLRENNTKHFRKKVREGSVRRGHLKQDSRLRRETDKGLGKTVF